MSTTTTDATNATQPLVISDYFKQKETEAESSKYSSSSDNSTLDKNDFLNLLVTQLQYQDPLSPADNQQMAAQMAQFSALEQTQNMATSLEEMGESIASMVEQQEDVGLTLSTSSATSLMGKTVRFQRDEATLSTAGSSLTWNVTATEGSELVVLDSEGEVVRRLGLDGKKTDGSSILDSNGDGSVTWDGKTDSGRAAPSGTYTIEVRNATTGDKSGNAWTDAVVAGVQFDSSGPQLVAGGDVYSMSDILAVAATTSDSAN